jgi:regulator of sigma E protease
VSELGRIVAMVLGISLVIFVHEFGHFLAARLCRVRVDVFSLGFGPRLLAWRRGATLYQLALLPLGGYVRMAGEEQEPGRAPAPHELQGKSVGQRFFIYSGGVLMNFAFALVVFPIVLANGVPLTEPIVGATEPGSPAWSAGVQPGSRVLSVNEREIIGFEHIAPEVALGPSDCTRLTLLEPGASTPRTLELVPVYSKSLGMYVLGLRPALDPAGTLEIDKGSPAFEAGLRSGDRLRSVAGAPPELSVEEQLLFAARDAGPIELAFVHGEGGVEERAQLPALPTKAGGAAILGVYPFATWVHDLRESQAVRALGLRKDDRILSANGVELRGDYDLLVGLRAGSDATRLLVERDGARRELLGPGLTGAEALALFRDVALRPDNASARVCVRPQSAAEEAGLRNGDRIVSLDGRPVSRFDDLAPIVKESGGRALQAVVRRESGGGEAATELSFAILPRPLPQPVLDYGISLKLARYTYQAPSPGVALRTGMHSSWRLMADSWLTLKRILTGQVSGENIGGIITIGRVSYSWAGEGLSKLFYFLCMLSVSLAFLNVLPIPVLDGGHLFFLLIEKLKGSPVSERVLSYSQIVGLVLIVSLVVYVTFNDIQRALK